jgi:topoisomerase-4 subunit B
MYIGRLGDGSNPDDGIYVLLKEVIDNSVDEFIMGAGDRIVVRLEQDKETELTKVSVRDYGRGIPLGKVVEAVSIINTGAKYNDDVFQFSVGLNGVGTKAVNALSSAFRVVAYRGGRQFEARFEQGVLKYKRETEARKERDGTLVEFCPDREIFGDYAYNHEFVEKRMWNYAYLNSGLTLSLDGTDYASKNGLHDLLYAEVGDSTLYDIGYARGDKIEFAFTHTNNYGEEYFSFVNGQWTSDGGTHLSAFREGFLKAINEFFQAAYKGEDIREGIAAAIAIKLKSPVFESQTKNKLGNTDIKPWILQEVKSGVDEFLRKNPQAAKRLQEKIAANEKLRTELNVVKKEAKEAARKIELRIPNLKDCKYHLGEPKGELSTIFLTEGLSAAGSMVSSRDVYTQAIFSLRGKPENMYGRSRTAIYKNEELYNMMMALGIESDIEGLRYGRIVIATDADYDGFHIRNLLLTFYLTFFEELITQERVFILETPLFRVRTKKDTRYCYSAKERDEAAKALGSGAETTRFKGLGEISPAEFGQFIGEDMRLVRVDVQTLKAVPEILAFYMGKNTPERREFIMQNLISDL